MKKSKLNKKSYFLLNVPKIIDFKYVFTTINIEQSVLIREIIMTTNNKSGKIDLEQFSNVC